jgi:anti-sigma factor RsiW
MSCEKYSGWMTDAALGELGAEREPELLAHALECDACREALRHARRVHAFVDRSVESLVAGEPTRQFAAGLRRRIGLESEPARFPWMAWSPIVAGALALVVFLAIMLAHVPRHHVTNPTRGSNLKSTPTRSELLSASAASPTNVTRTESKHDTVRVVHTRPATTAPPEIIVPTEQLSAAAQLSAAINSGRVDGNQLLAARQQYDRPLEVKPIEITPLEIPALDDATDKPAGSIQF